MSDPRGNVDPATVRGFGDEWSRFTYATVPDDEMRAEFAAYFRHVPPDVLRNAKAMDVGCGSGRWAKFVAPQVDELVLVDPSPQALAVAEAALRDSDNCHFYCTTADSLPVVDGSMDFVYSLGVLHHLPNPELGLKACVRALRPGGHLLVYLYYRFDNRPAWFRALWRISDFVRRGIARMPRPIRHVVSDVIAVSVYWPLARTSRMLQALGIDARNLPLAAYAHRSLYWMRTDALDRFGTRLEHRFTRAEIESMLDRVGLVDLKFVEDSAYWTVLARRPEL